MKKKNNKFNITSNMLRTSKSYSTWRKEVLKTQGSRCQICGSKKGLQVHHKIPVSKLLGSYFKNKKRKYIDFNETLNELESIPELWSISNGEVLCEFCHSLEHPENVDMLFYKLK
jgi:5-methylcytosine-specific restriction endonuclease McrA